MGVHALALNDPRDAARPVQGGGQADGGQDSGAQDEEGQPISPRDRLRRLVHLSCETLSRTSPIHAVLRGAADGHPFASELHQEMTRSRLAIQSANLQALLGPSLRDGLDPEQAAERCSALLSPELYQLVTVERQWDAHRFELWVGDLLERDLLD